MYTGLPPEGHGICSYAKPILRVDTLFDAALRAGVRPAIVSTSGSTLSKIFLDRPMDYYILDSVDEVNARAEQLLRRKDGVLRIAPLRRGHCADKAGSGP